MSADKPPLTRQQQAWFDAYTKGSLLDRNIKAVEMWLALAEEDDTV